MRRGLGRKAHLSSASNPELALAYRTALDQSTSLLALSYHIPIARHSRVETLFDESLSRNPPHIPPLLRIWFVMEEMQPMGGSLQFLHGHQPRSFQFSVYPRASSVAELLHHDLNNPALRDAAVLTNGSPKAG